MSYTDIVGYTYDADIYCPKHLPLRTNVDSEEVGVIFEGSEEWDEGAYCCECHEELIANPHHYTIGDTIIRVEFEQMRRSFDPTLFPNEDYTCYRVTLRFYAHSGRRITTTSFMLYQLKNEPPLSDTQHGMGILRDYMGDYSCSLEDYLAAMDPDTQEEAKMYHATYIYGRDIHDRLKLFLGDDLFRQFL